MAQVFGFVALSIEDLNLFQRNTSDRLTRIAFEDLEDEEIVLFIHPLETAAYVLDVPPGKLNELERAVAYMLEDRLASPVDDVFISLGKSDKSGKRSVILTDLELMERLQTHPDLSHRPWRLISPLSLMEDGDAVAFDDCIAFDDGHRKFVLEKSFSDDLKGHMLKEFVDMPDSKIYGHSLAKAFGREAESDLTGLEWCVSQYTHLASENTDLRQGRFAATKFNLPSLASFKNIAIGGGALAVAFLGVQASEVRARGKLSQNLEGQITQIASQISPQSAMPQDPSEARALRPSASLTRQADGIDMISDIYAAFKGLENVALEKITFNRATGQLQAVLVYSEFGVDTKIKEKLSQKYKVTLGDTRSRGGVVTGNMTLEVS